MNKYLLHHKGENIEPNADNSEISTLLWVSSIQQQQIQEIKLLEKFFPSLKHGVSICPLLIWQHKNQLLGFCSRFVFLVFKKGLKLPCVQRNLIYPHHSQVKAAIFFFKISSAEQ